MDDGAGDVRADLATTTTVLTRGACVCGGGHRRPRFSLPSEAKTRKAERNGQNPAATRALYRVERRGSIGSAIAAGGLRRMMHEEPDTSLGTMRATVSREIVRLQAEYYGKGPSKAKTYIVDDLVVVVLEESFTRAEKTLSERGEREAIQHIRRRFQQQMAESFTSIVERATGRRVRAFLSETDIEHDVSVETFLLADERPDMTGFEDG